MALEVGRLQEISEKLSININDYQLMEQSLTHRSYCGEAADVTSNERLEFLGDAVLGLVVCEYLYSTYPERAEGDLAKAKAVAVSEPVLADAAKQLGINQMVLMSTGEEASGGKNRHSIMSDTFEAVVAVIYLDSGLEAARQFCLTALASILDDIERQEHIRDYKSLLQEFTQAKHKRAPKYVVIKEEGADHDKTFLVEARLDSDILGRGSGKSKKQAEQAAALEALQKTKKKLQSEREPGE